MAGFWTRLYYRVSDESTKYFWILLVSNAILVFVSIIMFYVFGTIKIVGENEEELDRNDESWHEIKRGVFFMAMLMIFLALTQLYIGIHSVDHSLNTDPEEERLRSVRLLYDGHADKPGDDRVLGLRRGAVDKSDTVLLEHQQEERHDIRCRKA